MEDTTSYSLEETSTGYLLKNNDIVRTLPETVCPVDLCYRITKKLLYEYAWEPSPLLPNSNESIKELFIIALKLLAKKHPKKNVIRRSFEAAQKSRNALKGFLSDEEKERSTPIAYPEDYSDDSDDDSDVEATQFQGAESAFNNNELKKSRKKFKNYLRESSENKTKSNEADKFRTALNELYKKHLEKVLKENSNSTKERVCDIRKTESGYELVWRNDDKKYTTHTTIDKEPRVLLCRGIGYFTDRWDGKARRANGNELLEHPFYPLSVTMQFFDPGRQYTDYLNCTEDQQQKCDDSMREQADKLKKNLTLLRQSYPIIVKQGTKYRIFDNWLAYLQYMYTNGIDRFKSFIELLQKEESPLKGLFPHFGENIFISFSELFPHALRYAAGAKEPYKDNALDVRRNNEGKPENPHLGKLYVTSHPWQDFNDWDKPHMIRELSELGHVTTGNHIGPELEVSFLGHVPTERFVSAHKVRVPSFERENYPPHYHKKYGIDSELYTLIYNYCRKYPFNHSNRVDFEIHLIEYIALYHAVRLALLELSRAEDKNQLIMFLHPQGGYTTRIPMWKQSSKKKIENDENEIAKQIIQDHSLEHEFYAKGGQVYSNSQLKIFEVQPEWLPPKYQKDREDRLPHFFGDKPPQNSLSVSELSQESHDFSGDASSLNISNISSSNLSEINGSFSSDSESSSPHGEDDALPDTLHLPDGLTVWDIDVKGEGNCLFYSLIIGLLLPYTRKKEDAWADRYYRLFPDDKPEQAKDLKQALHSYRGSISWSDTHLHERVSRLRTYLAKQFQQEKDQTFLELFRKSNSNEIELLLFSRYIGVKVREFSKTCDGMGKTFDSSCGQPVNPAPNLNQLHDEHLIVYYTKASEESKALDHYHCLIETNLVPWHTEDDLAATLHNLGHL